MQGIKRIEQEAAEDIFFGQVVIVWARWFLIVTGMLLVLWTTDNKDVLSIGIVPVVALMAINFYLHGRYLTERPANPKMIGLASLLDLGAITSVVVFWSDSIGLASQFFIFYFPAVLAFGFVMPRRATAVYTTLALAVYAGTCFAAGPGADLLLKGDVGAVKVLIMRLITLAAMGGLGTYYWRIQRDRRNTVSELADSSGRTVGA